MSHSDPRILFVDTCNSTNDIAHNLERHGAQCAVVANHQTQGRGRLGRVWVSEPEQGVYLSWRCLPPIPPSQGGALPLVAAVAIHDLCVALGLAPTLKWPNDILINRKKLAGILCEARIHGEKWHAVVGVGINIRPPKQGWSTELSATSIHEELKHSPSRDELASDLLNHLERTLEAFKLNGMPWLISQWIARGPELGTEFAHRKQVGTYEGLTEDGSIRLRIDGRVATISAGDIELV
jgi:BirA family biotin operon repressor/biotin-[acetyl-CoA-carboxylase] ligase